MRACITWLFVAALLLVVVECSAVNAAKPPNIVFIYTDDQAPTAIGASGNSQIQTPHLDKLFREGAYLVNSFVTTPVCSPSRASLMTSRYGTELGIVDWINPRREPELGLEPSIITWPEILANSGYETGLVGKWHLGTADRFHPTKTGFEYFMGFRAGGTSPVNPVLEKDGLEKKFEGFTADVLTDHAIDFLRTKAPQRFLLSLHYRAPHAAWLPVRDEDWAPYKELDPQIPNPAYPNLDVAKIKKWTREYMASVSSVDRNVGRLLASIDELGLRNKTVVIFTSDHGYNLGHNGVWYKGNAQWQLTKLPRQVWAGIPPKQRPNLYDQAIRVPTAIRWPGVIKPGTVVEETVSNLDWYPTLVEIAGEKLPEGQTIRGNSLVPLLKNQMSVWDNDFYCEYSMRHGATVDMRAYRTPKWKLMIDFGNKGREELYDLSADPAETNNLLPTSDAEILAIRARLETKILARMREIQDPALATLEVTR